MTTYVPDLWKFYGSHPFLYHGGIYSQRLNYGPFFVSYSALDQSSGIGCRLQERPPKQI